MTSTPENFVFQYEQQDLPEGASFFLCDGVGNILYSETSFTHEDGLDAYILDLVHRIEAGELEDATSYVIDLDGRERAVDYSRLANGWYSIVTAPRAVILGAAPVGRGAVWHHGRAVCGASGRARRARHAL